MPLFVNLFLTFFKFEFFGNVRILPSYVSLASVWKTFMVCIPFEIEFEGCVTGHYMYKKPGLTWLTKNFQQKRNLKILTTKYFVKIVKNEGLSEYCTTVILTGATISCKITGKWENKLGNGLEVPCIYKGYGPIFIVQRIEILIMGFFRSASGYLGSVRCLALSDVSYSDECRTKKYFQYAENMILLFFAILTDFNKNNVKTARFFVIYFLIIPTGAATWSNSNEF